MTGLSAPPVLSTPDTHSFTETAPVPADASQGQYLSDGEFSIRYEIDRTIDEIRRNKWRRVALQFPDSMLGDSARIYRCLERGLRGGQRRHIPNETVESTEAAEDEAGVRPVADKDPTAKITIEEEMAQLNVTGTEHDDSPDNGQPTRLTILGDTSYGSCCVDEIAAEHLDADVVVHYGRSCLSPTARLPVIYVFTRRELDHDRVCQAFQEAFKAYDEKIIVTADIPFATHVEAVSEKLREAGYSNIFASDIVHDPSSLIPNRTVPDALKLDPSHLSEWSLFHVSEPPTSLLLTLSARMKGVHIYPTTDRDGTASLHQSNTSLILRRRYALITSLSTVSVWGILINTLSVKNYLHIVDHVKQQIAKADKKSYLFVVGKLNAAKVANFAEIGGWVVIGCWESSLVDSKDFYRPIITPFELELVLQKDSERLWTGEWRGDFQEVLDREEKKDQMSTMPGAFIDDEDEGAEEEDVHDYDSEEESAPPEFDLRTGRYVSHARPMRNGRSSRVTGIKPQGSTSSTALTQKSKGDMLAVNGIASPAAEFLAQQRSWKGLGSDFEIKYEDEEEQGSLIEEGRTGVARGYTVGESSRS